VTTLRASSATLALVVTDDTDRSSSESSTPHWRESRNRCLPPATTAGPVRGCRLRRQRQELKRTVDTGIGAGRETCAHSRDNSGTGRGVASDDHDRSSSDSLETGLARRATVDASAFACLARQRWTSSQCRLRRQRHILKPAVAISYDNIRTGQSFLSSLTTTTDPQANRRPHTGAYRARIWCQRDGFSVRKLSDPGVSVPP